ncbi:3'-5' exonuclease [Herminiimonas sp. NPDC097707]|uniref:3'-5' exonuclease n=1 Tax=Herminiimonas sp. NPDC097707 TaxID=3364007 RepID=UPI00383BD788
MQQEENHFFIFPLPQEHYTAFFGSSQARIERLKSEGSQFIGDIKTFRKVFQSRTGISISTIHGVKGVEFDAVITYALLEDMVPHFNDPNGQESAMKLLSICHRITCKEELVPDFETGSSPVLW